MEMYLVPVITLVSAWILGAFFTKMLIPALEKKQFRQFVREVGPQSHLHKTGTPSMGGIAIISATIITALVATIATKTFDMRILVILIMMVLFGLIGFIDDYEKAIKEVTAKDIQTLAKKINNGTRFIAIYREKE